MSKRRPTAHDRDLADHIYGLEVGEYRIEIYAYPRSGDPGGGPGERRYYGLAELKREGQLSLNVWGPKRIDIYPVPGGRS